MLVLASGINVLEDAGLEAESSFGFVVSEEETTILSRVDEELAFLLSDGIPIWDEDDESATGLEFVTATLFVIVVPIVAVDVDVV